MKLHLIIVFTLVLSFSIFGQVMQRPRIQPSSKATPTPTPGKITPDKVTQCFSENEIDINSKKLESNYHGNDLLLILDEISRRKHIEKDEFETTKQFNERVETTSKKPLIGNIYYVSNIALENKGDFKYDADKERMTVSFDLERSLFWSAPCAESTLYSSSDGRYVLNFEPSGDRSVDYVYLSFDLPIEVAKTKKTDLRLLFIASLLPENQKPTRYDPITPTGKQLHFNLKDVWVYDISTGEILAKNRTGMKKKTESSKNSEISMSPESQKFL